eukprot:13007125-Ditylum_brightwellii.AAC.1
MEQRDQYQPDRTPLPPSPQAQHRPGTENITHSRDDQQINTRNNNKTPANKMGVISTDYTTTNLNQMGTTYLWSI